MYWPCRYELMQNNPKILFDGAHNPAAIKLLIKNISFDISFNKLPLFAVLGMSKDHNSLLFAKNWIQTNNNLLPKKLIITKSMAQRSIHPKKLIDSFIKYGFNVKIILNSFKALKIAIKLAKNYNGYVLVTGSLYLVGELRTYFKHVPCDPIQPKY